MMGDSLYHHPAGPHVIKWWKNQPGSATIQVDDNRMSPPESGWVEESLHDPWNDAGNPIIRDSIEALLMKTDEFWTWGLVSVWQGVKFAKWGYTWYWFCIMDYAFCTKKRKYFCSLKWSLITFVLHSFDLLLLQFYSHNFFLSYSPFCGGLFLTLS